MLKVDSKPETERHIVFGEDWFGRVSGRVQVTELYNCIIYNIIKFQALVLINLNNELEIDALELAFTNFK